MASELGEGGRWWEFDAEDCLGGDRRCGRCVIDRRRDCWLEKELVPQRKADFTDGVEGRTGWRIKVHLP